MFKKFKKVLAAFLCVMLALTSVQLYTLAEPGSPLVDLGTFTYATATSLGSVNDYATFAMDYYQKNHQEGTFAANVYHPSGAVFGITSNVKNYVNSDRKYIYLNDIDPINKMASSTNSSGNSELSANVLLGSKIGIDRTYNNNSGVKLYHKDDASDSKEFNNATDLGLCVRNIAETTYQIDFNHAFAALRTYATTKELKAQTEKTQVTFHDGAGVDPNSYQIDIVCGSGENIVNISAEKFESDKLNITGRDGLEDYSLIINVKGLSKESYEFNKNQGVKIDNVSAGGYVDNAGKLLWNLGAYTGTVTFGETNAGVILGPNATINVSASHNGSVYAKVVTNDNCEIHQNYFKERTPDPEPEPSVVKISKIAAGGGTELSGADLKVEKLTAENEVDTTFTTQSWTSDGSVHEITGLADGTYRLTETSAPIGYQVAEAMTFTLEGGELTKVNGVAKTDKVVMEDKLIPTPEPSVVKISKIAAGGGTELSGADLKIEKLTAENEVDTTFTTQSWTSDGSVHEITGLADGTYRLTETSAPTGYQVAEAMTFTIEGGKLTKVNGTTFTAGTVVMVDKQSTVEISKVAVGGGEELKGANLKVEKLTDEGEIDSSYTAEKWMTGISVHKITGLADGTYRLTETSAPEGFQVAEAMTFTLEGGKLTKVNGEAKTDKVVMEDKLIPAPEPSHVKISKIAAGGGTELAGADLKVEKLTAENEVDTTFTAQSWTSDGTVHEITGLADGTYRLTETSAPEGYQVAEAMTFTLEGGKLTKVNGEAKTDKVVMEDKQIEPANNKTFSMTKVRKENQSDKLQGSVYYLYEKMSQKKTMKELRSIADPHEIQFDNIPAGYVKVDEQVTDENGEVTFSGLLGGAEYCVKEAIAPDGSMVSEDPILFTVSDTGKIEIVDNGHGTIEVNKDGTVTWLEPSTMIGIKKLTVKGDYVPGAELAIYDENHNKVLTWKSGSEEYVITGKLIAGKSYTLKELVAPDGYEIAADVTFTVDMTANSVDEYEKHITMIDTEKDKPDPKVPETSGDPKNSNPKDPETSGKPKTEQPSTEQPGTEQPTQGIVSANKVTSANAVDAANTSNVKTNDHNYIVLPIIIIALLISGSCVAYIVIKNKKTKGKDEL